MFDWNLADEGKAESPAVVHHRRLRRALAGMGLDAMDLRDLLVGENITDLPETAPAKRLARKSFRDRSAGNPLHLLKRTDVDDVI